MGPLTSRRECSRWCAPHSRAPVLGAPSADSSARKSSSRLSSLFRCLRSLRSTSCEERASNRCQPNPPACIA